MRTGIALILLALAAGCSQTAPKEDTKPQLVGKVPSQPGNCFFRGADGKAFVAPC